MSPTPGPSPSSPLRALVAVGLVVAGLAHPSSRALVGTVMVLLALIALHEAGHLLAAKRAKVGATEFAIGFGPVLWASQPHGGTTYSLRAIPFGGYVRIVGMSSSLPDSAPDNPGPGAVSGRSFEDVSWLRKMSIVVAGPAANVAVSAVCLLVLFATLGVPTATRAIDVVPSSRAERAGLRSGDVVVAVDDATVEDFASFAAAVSAPATSQSSISQPASSVLVTVERDGAPVTVAVAPPHDGARLGVASRVVSDPLAPSKAIVMAVTTTGRFAQVTVGSVGSLARSVFDMPAQVLSAGGEDSDGSRPLSPVGAARLAQDSAESDGAAGPILLIAAVSMFLAVFNMLPIPPLDGGHAAVLVFERVGSIVARRPVRVDRARLNPVAVVVVALVLMLGVSSLILDLISPVVTG